MSQIHFETLGCKLNQIETESLAQAFTRCGFSVTDKTPSAEALSPKPLLCVVNTCTVTGKAEQKARRLIRLLIRTWPDTPVLVTGCYAEVEAETIASIDPAVRVLPGSRKNELPDLPEFMMERFAAFPDKTVFTILDEFIRNESGTVPPFRLSTDNFHFHSRASIKVQDGCNNKCAYCRIRLARGTAVSLPADEVISRIRSIEEAGWNEVILTGVNLSQYESDGGDFADLLNRILRETTRIQIRISSLYPERVDERLTPILAHERICPHFHLSVQSGSDRILALMRRPYTASMVHQAANRLRSVKENPFIACDIITGFPSETDEDFEQTFAMCSEIGFAWIHAFPFSPRPGTEAYTMRPHIPERIAGERVARLSILAEENRQTYRDYWIGRTLPAIVETDSGANGTTVLTENYLPVVIPETGLRRGSRVMVRLTGLTHGVLDN